MATLKNAREIEIMAEGGRVLAEVMAEIVARAKEGISLKELDKLANLLIKKAGAEPAFLNYRPSGAKKSYKASICASLNEVVVHGFPGDYNLRSGDVLKLDFGVKFRGFNTDAAATVAVDQVSSKSLKLIEATREALADAISQCRPGKTLGDIGYAVENCAKRYGFAIIKDLTGHGIGRKLHEEPTIFNYGDPGMGLRLKPGMVLAVEPMLSAGSNAIVQRSDESWATADDSMSAHFEHTVAVTEKGPRILTLAAFGRE